MDEPQISMTPPATAKVKALIAEDASTGTKLRMFVQGGGCSGFQYGFTFEDIANEDDHVIVVDGVTLLVDVMSMQYLVGVTVDYEENIDGTRFVVKNPNAQSTCGCGSSFSV